MKNLCSYLSVVLLGLTCTACYNSDKYDTVDPSIIRLQTFTGQAEANGAAAVKISAKLSGQAAKSRRAVVFKTSRGSFIQGKGDSLIVNAGDDFIAEAELVSMTPGKAFVNVTASGVHSADTASITFRQAYPTGISVSVDSIAVSDRPNSIVAIAASLTSGNGKPSTGHPVEFHVYDASVEVGAFLNGVNSANTDASGISRIRYSPIGATPQRFLTITATTKGANNIALPVATTRIYLYHR